MSYAFFYKDSTQILWILLLQNELLTCLWYLNLRCTLRGLEVIQKFNNDDNERQLLMIIDENWCC